jgi:hypothetical protein
VFLNENNQLEAILRVTMPLYAPQVPTHAVCYKMLTEWLRVEAADARRVCQALSQTRWTEPKALWRAIAMMTCGADLVHLVRDQMTPQHLVHVLTLLEKEKRLRPDVVRRVEARILEETNAMGAWI